MDIKEKVSAASGIAVTFVDAAALPPASFTGGDEFQATTSGPETASQQSKSNRERLDELAASIPSVEDLDSIAIVPPREWVEEPSWKIKK